MPGRGKYKSIRNPRQYRALKRKGWSKSKAAAVSNSAWNKGWRGKRGRKR